MYLQGWTLWKCMEIRIFDKDVPVWFGCKYIHPQRCILGICMEMRIFYKGRPLACVSKHVYFQEGVHWTCLEYDNFLRDLSRSAWNIENRAQCWSNAPKRVNNYAKYCVSLFPFVSILISRVSIVRHAYLVASIRIYQYLFVSICIWYFFVLSTCSKSRTSTRTCFCCFHVAYPFVSIPSARMLVNYKQIWSKTA